MQKSMTVFEIAKYRMRLIGTNSETVHLVDSQFIFIDSEILLTIGFLGLECLLNLLFHKAECLADFGEILVFIS